MVQHTPFLQAAIGQSHLTDEALEELSEAREPRQRAGRPVGGVPAQNALPKFSTWAEGEQTQLDSVTLSKHVKQMVDVCVCVYVCMGEVSVVCAHRLCSRCMIQTRVAPSATRSLSPSPPISPSLSVSQCWTKTSEAPATQSW